MQRMQRLYRKDFRYRNHFSFYFYFTTLFNGGLISTYILYVRFLGLKNSIWALILPNLFSTFYMIVMRSFMSEMKRWNSRAAAMTSTGTSRLKTLFSLRPASSKAS